MDENLCFPAGTVVSHLENREKYRAIHELIKRAPVFDQVRDKQEFENAVVKREKALSTGLGHGIALAHGKTSSVKKLFIALGISRDGIDFDSPDGEPVHFLFIIGNPPDAQDEYIKVIGALSFVFRDPHFRKRLYSLKNCNEMEITLKQAFKKALRR